MKLAWLTDLHLNFLTKERAFGFFDEVNGCGADAVLISGDIASARSLGWSLREMHARIQQPIYFVLGNHDFYHSSFARVRATVPVWLSELPRMTWLTNAGICQLTPETALIGHDGWADGRFGDFFASTLELNDYYVIEDFAVLSSKAQRLDLLHQLGDAAAAYFGTTLPAALEYYAHVIVLTHVPPFREAAWHGDRPSDDNGLPHFASQAAGVAIRAAAQQYPRRQITVLCGHTHSPCDVQILPNLRVIAGEAEYELPAIQRLLEV
jgi:3',5'-cyclic-AMP phosphodiesterase